MNKTSIEWTDYTWNPITGCLHPCRNIYCYNTMKATSPLNRFGAIFINNKGKKVFEKDWHKRESNKTHIALKGEIYPYGYDPTFYPHRMDAPKKVRKPSRIFVVDTGDMFGSWVPSEWIESILQKVRLYNWHTYQFLTKNPKRLFEFEFPSNSWVGVSVTSDKDKASVDILKKVKATVRFLSIEPLLGDIKFDFDGVQWVIVGAQTGKNPVRPEREWIDNIIKKAHRRRIAVFTKDNLLPYYPFSIKEFPQSGKSGD